MLDEAKAFVRLGGNLCYITCSVLPEENARQVEAFLKANADFSMVPYRDVWRETIGTEPPASADGSDRSLLLTPAQHDTDGFFVAVMRRTD